MVSLLPRVGDEIRLARLDEQAKRSGPIDEPLVAREIRDRIRGAPRLAEDEAVLPSVRQEDVDGVGPGTEADDRRDGLQDPVQVGDVARRRGDRGEDLASLRLRSETLVGVLFVGEIRDDDLGPPGRSVTVPQEERPACRGRNAGRSPGSCL